MLLGHLLSITSTNVYTMSIFFEIKLDILGGNTNA